MPLRRTTKKHFIAFVRESKFWIDRLGLDYQVAFTHNKDGSGLAASTFHYKDRTATFNLCQTWDSVTPLNMSMIKDCALHEVVHLAVGDLNILALNRFLTERELDVVLEATVCRLVKLAR